MPKSRKPKSLFMFNIITTVYLVLYLYIDWTIYHSYSNKYIFNQIDYYSFSIGQSFRNLKDTWIENKDKRRTCTERQKYNKSIWDGKQRKSEYIKNDKEISTKLFDFIRFSLQICISELKAFRKVSIMLFILFCNSIS